MAFEYIGTAFMTALQPFNLVVMFLSTLVGLVMGVLPGLSATMAIALLTGLTYNFPTQTAILSLLSIYVGSISGGCQSAILLNIPGTPASAANRHRGWHGAVCAPRTTRLPLGQCFRPRIWFAQIRGQLLHGVRRQQQDEYQREERDQKQTRHG